MKLTAFILFSGFLFAQAIRIDPQSVMTTKSSGNSSQPLLSVPGSQITLCTAPSCAGSAVSYTDATAGTACSVGAPVTLAGTNVCTPYTDKIGNFGFWLVPGQYMYKVTLPNGTVHGPFPITAPANPGGGGGGGGGGTVTSIGLTGQANQITVGGSSSPITTNGAWSLSFPNALILPSGTTATTVAPGDNSTSPATTAFVQAALALKAPLASPTFSGTVTVPITGGGTQCVQVSNTGQLSGVGAACNAGGGGSGSVTSIALNGTANQITVTGASPITTNGTWTLSLPSTLLLPNGTTATTQTAGDSTTSVATDAFVAAGLALKAPTASPTFTGTLTTPLSGGGTQCVQVNNAGALSGTGATCGTGGGGVGFPPGTGVPQVTGGAAWGSTLGVVTSVGSPGLNTNLPTELAVRTAENLKENSLGNPGTNGFVLSSTTAGTRSWVAQNAPMVYPSGTGIPQVAGGIWGSTLGFVTTIGTPGSATNVPSESAVRSVASTLEPALGNPASTGYLLSSTTGGVRSWVPSPGGIAYPSGTGIVQVTGGTAWGSTLNLVTSVGTPGTNTNVPTEQAVRSVASTLEPALGNPSTNGYVLSSTTAGVRSWIASGSGGLSQLTGDVLAGPGTGSQVATLANTAVTAGTYGDATDIPQITVDSKGRITAAVTSSISAIASGQTAMPTSALAANTCTVATTATAAGVLSTDALAVAYNGDPTAITGYGAGTSGGLTLRYWPGSGNVNFKQCNETGSSITPGALTVNWKVVRVDSVGVVRSSSCTGATVVGNVVTVPSGCCVTPSGGGTPVCAGANTTCTRTSGDGFINVGFDASSGAGLFSCWTSVTTATAGVGMTGGVTLATATYPQTNGGVYPIARVQYVGGVPTTVTDSTVNGNQQLIAFAGPGITDTTTAGGRAVSVRANGGTCTFASPPATPTISDFCTFTDATNTTTCTGGGAAKTRCFYDGTSWVRP